ncbi:YbgC/FadM family acyl-CoA thioesterase [Campylobacter sp. JMF_08 NE1]|uniref:YbgC/FadM family acyl-CoA thioesterase n=1 Tax=Campylobacter sp. JMF_08 NE1 TaxID=2983821 RepID=UPI0022E9A6D0|nr:YbgC/FadM family acyl-CoA thioesterase [Campylobacter sp. JMF_08 NE1]MDA3047758.1 YbgC/FadM family acyl-CoA thioesterase [Campylobacter sp. JMF_08 NE1]
MKFRIYYDDTDAQGIVYHANYIKFCERARSEALMRAGVDFHSKQAFFVVSDLQAKFLRSAVLGDELEIKTTLKELKNASAVLTQKIYKLKDINGREFDELIFAQDVRVAYLQNGKPVKFSDEIVEFFKGL